MSSKEFSSIDYFFTLYQLTFVKLHKYNENQSISRPIINYSECTYYKSHFFNVRPKSPNSTFYVHNFMDIHQFLFFLPRNN